jgi:hypothetical protein
VPHQSTAALIDISDAPGLWLGQPYRESLTALADAGATGWSVTFRPLGGRGLRILLGGPDRRALEAGAITLMGATGEPADRPYRERSAFVVDAFGNFWYIATRLASARPRKGLCKVLEPCCRMCIQSARGRSDGGQAAREYTLRITVGYCEGSWRLLVVAGTPALECEGL